MVVGNRSNLFCSGFLFSITFFFQPNLAFFAKKVKKELSPNFFRK